MPTLELPEPYDFDVSTARYRAFGPDLANLWHEGGLHRVVDGREVRIESAPGGVDVEPLDAATETVVRHYVGGPFDLGDFYAFAQDDPVLAQARPAAAWAASAAQPGPLRDARDLDHGPAGLALLGVRGAQPADRAVRRAGRARVGIPDAGADRRGARGGADRARVLAPEGRVRDRDRARGRRLGRARRAAGRAR